LQPAIRAAVHDALGPQDHAVLAAVQRRQGLLQRAAAVFVGGLPAPAGEHLVGVVVVVMVPAAADAVLIVVVFVVVMVAALVLLVLVMVVAAFVFVLLLVMAVVMAF